MNFEFCHSRGLCTIVKHDCLATVYSRHRSPAGYRGNGGEQRHRKHHGADETPAGRAQAGDVHVRRLPADDLSPLRPHHRQRQKPDGRYTETRRLIAKYKTLIFVLILIHHNHASVY